MTGLRYLNNVSTLRLDTARCNGCRMCIVVCPHGVFAVTQRKARIIDLDACMECGACELNCPEDALRVKAGVGCASAIIQGAIRSTEPSCGCDSKESSCC